VTLSVGVVGVGAIGSDHVKRIASRVSGARVGALYDLDQARARQVAAPLGATVHSRAGDVVEDPAVDAVVIASPGETHAELTLACVEAGKPVLCEKPLATTSADCLKVVESEVAHGRRLIQVGFMRRYDPSYRQVKATLDGGEIGEALVVHCRHRNPSVPPTFATEMALTDSVVHEIDTMRWMLGQEIRAITVLRPRRTPLAAEHVQDPLLVLMETEAGVIVDVEAFVNCQYGYDVRCEVVGSTGTASLQNPVLGATTHAGAERYRIPDSWRIRFGQAYVEELQEWVDSLQTKTGEGPSAWDGYAATAVAEAGLRALESGSRVEVALERRPPFYDEPARSVTEPGPAGG
jgi:myo-inositol 2-dehydrogenase/D-chiro-inositol 1-dehydrogenase